MIATLNHPPPPGYSLFDMYEIFCYIFRKKLRELTLSTCRKYTNQGNRAFLQISATLQMWQHIFPKLHSGNLFKRCVGSHRNIQLFSFVYTFQQLRLKYNRPLKRKCHMIILQQTMNHPEKQPLQLICVKQTCTCLSTFLSINLLFYKTSKNLGYFTHVQTESTIFALIYGTF